MKLESVFNKHTVTYSPSWTLIPTHYCRNACGYCVFVERARAQLLSSHRHKRKSKKRAGQAQQNFDNERRRH
jgi:2-iminoacetate synthase ThiH